MSREDFDALIALHDRWTSYDVLFAILALSIGFLLIVAGLFIVWGGKEIGTLLATVGACVALVGLNKQPYMAR